jgi:3-phosphoshikimate 1-carboxyvinyltransferase
VAALIVPESALLIEGVCVNPHRTGLLEVLEMMGGCIRLQNHREMDGEPVADIAIRHSRLRAVDVRPHLVPSMIDEFPIFFVAAAFADGISRASGLAELRVKESDRIAAMAAALGAIGARVHVSGDGIAIEGTGGLPLPGGGTVATLLDHRVAMSLAVAGLHCRRPVAIDDMAPAETSFSGFTTLIEELTHA